MSTMTAEAATATDPAVRRALITHGHDRDEVETMTEAAARRALAETGTVTADALKVGARYVDNFTAWAEVRQVAGRGPGVMEVTWRLADGRTDVARYTPSDRFTPLDKATDADKAAACCAPCRDGEHADDGTGTPCQCCGARMEVVG